MAIDVNELLKLFGQQAQQGAAPPVQPPMPMQGQQPPMADPVNSLHASPFENIMNAAQGKKSGGAIGTLLKLFGI